MAGEWRRGRLIRARGCGQPTPSRHTTGCGRGSSPTKSGDDTGWLAAPIELVLTQLAEHLPVDSVRTPDSRHQTWGVCKLASTRSRASTARCAARSWGARDDVSLHSAIRVP